MPIFSRRLARTALLASASVAGLIIAASGARADVYAVGGGTITTTQNDNSTNNTGTGGGFLLQPNTVTSGDTISVSGVSITNTAGGLNGRALDFGYSLPSDGSYAVTMSGSTLNGNAAAGTAAFMAATSSGTVSFDSTGGTANTITGKIGVQLYGQGANASVVIKTGADTITTNGEILYGVSGNAGTVSIDSFGATLTSTGAYGISATAGTSIVIGGQNGGISSSITVNGGSGIFLGANGIGSNYTASITLAGGGSIAAQTGMMLRGSQVAVDSYGTINGTLAAINGFNAQNLTVTLRGTSSTTGNIMGTSGNDVFNIYTGANTSGTRFLAEGGTDTLNLLGTGGGVLDLSIVVLEHVTKSESGAWTLSKGTSASLDISAGQITTSGSVEIGTLSGSGGSLVLGAGTLTATATSDSVSNATISGTGGLAKAGTGTLSLTASNSYGGGTTVAGGFIRFDSLSNLGTGNVTLNGGGLQWASGSAVDVSQRPIVLGANGGSLDTNGNNVTFATPITGTGPLTKLGSGTLTLTSVQTYTGGTVTVGGSSISGGTTVDGGTLLLTGTGRLPSAGAIVVNSGTLDFNGISQTVGSLYGTGGVVALGAGTLTVNQGASVAFAGTITGTGGLVKQGGGSLILTGSNTYSGQTTVTEGNLQFGEGGTTGSIPGNVHLANPVPQNSRLVFRRSDTFDFSGVVSGAGQISHSGSGNLILSGINTYSGGTTISNGTLSYAVLTLSNSSAAGTGPITTSLFATIDYANGITVANSLSIGGATRVQTLAGVTATQAGAVSGAFEKIGSGTLIVTANMTSGARITAGTLQIGNGGTSGSITSIIQNFATLAFNRSDALTYGGAMSGTGALVKAGAGTLTLTGASTFSGGSTATGGLINFTALNNFGTGTITLNGGGLQWAAGNSVDVSPRLAALGASGGVFDTNGNNVILASAVGGAGGVTKAGNGALIITAANTYAGGTTISAGTLQLGNGGTTGVIVGDVINNGVLAFNRSDSVTFAGAISGSGNVTKNGTGTLTLTGTSTYTGGTTINSGKIVTNGALASTVVAQGGAAVENGGLIQTSGDFAYGMIANGAGASLSNSGTIQTSGSGGNGIYLFGNGHAGVNTGAVSANGSISFGLFSVGNGNSFTNGGTVTSAGTAAVAFSMGAGETGLFVNNAGGSVVAASGWYAVYSGQGGTMTVRNFGVLQGTIHLSGQGDTLLIGAGGEVRGEILVNGSVTVDRADNYNFTGSYSGAGSLQKLGSGTLVLSGNNAYSGGTIVATGTLSLAHNNAAGTGTITTTGSIIDYANGITVANGVVLASNTTQLQVAGGATATQSGTISETGGSRPLEKTGNGTLILTGANTYTGGTTVSGGTLVVGNGATAGSITGNVVNNATLAFDRSDEVTFSGVISGPGMVNQAGRGTTILTGANIYGGGTIVTGGILRLGAGGSIGTGPVTVTGGVFDPGSQALNSGNLTGTGGTINLGSGGLLFNMTGNQTIGSGLTGNGGIVKSGTGTLTLTGNNSFSGSITVAGGTLSLGSNNAAGTGAITTTGSVIDYASGITIANPIVVNSNTTQLQVVTGSATQAGAISEAGGSRPLEKIGAGTLIVTGASTYTGGTTITAGTFQIGDGGTTGDIAGNIANRGTLVFNRSDAVTFAGVISGSGGVNKLGAGTLTLAGSSTYTGLTTVSSGALVVNSSIGSSTVTVASGATLGGTGTVGSTVVQAGGSLAPGNGIGTLTVNGPLALAANSNTTVDLSPTASDRVVVNGSATLNGTLALAQGAGTYTAETSLTLLTAGSITGTFANVTGLSFANLRSELVYSATNVQLVLSPLAINFVGASPNQIAVAAAINAGPLGNALQMALSNSARANPAQMADLLDSVSGEIHASVRSAALDNSRMIRNTVQDHLAAKPEGTSLWGQVFADYGWLDSDGNAAGTRRNNAGFIAGLDTAVAEGLRIGLGGAYMEHKVGMAARSSRATGSRGSLLAYASYESGAFSIRLGGDYGWGSDDITRTVTALGETQASRRDGESGGFFARISYDLALPLLPYAGIAHAYAWNGDFAETGGLAALTGTAASESQTYALLGFNLLTEAFDISGFALMPRADIAWRHVFDTPAPGQAVALVATGQGFPVLGAPVSSDAAALQFGLDLRMAPGALFSVGYDGLLSGQGQSHAVRGGLRWRF